MTPDEVQAWVDTITSAYTEEEIEALEVKAEGFDVNRVRNLLDQFIDQVGQFMSLEVILKAMQETCTDLQAAVGEDE